MEWRGRGQQLGDQRGDDARDAAESWRWELRRGDGLERQYGCFISWGRGGVVKGAGYTDPQIGDVWGTKQIATPFSDTGALARTALGKKMVNLTLSILSGKYYYTSLDLTLQGRQAGHCLCLCFCFVFLLDWCGNYGSGKLPEWPEWKKIQEEVGLGLAPRTTTSFHLFIVCPPTRKHYWILGLPAILGRLDRMHSENDQRVLLFGF